MLESKMDWKMMLQRSPLSHRLFLVVLASCYCLASVPAETGSSCLKHCVCKWKGGKESVTCHQAGLTEVPASGLEGTVQVNNFLICQFNPVHFVIKNWGK